MRWNYTRSFLALVAGGAVVHLVFGVFTPEDAVESALGFLFGASLIGTPFMVIADFAAAIRERRRRPLQATAPTLPVSAIRSR